MIDTHCHLDLLKKEDLEETLKDEGLECLITVGYDRKTIKNAIRLSEEKNYLRQKYMLGEKFILCSSRF